MAMGILGAYGALNKKELPDYVLVVELSLDGGFVFWPAICVRRNPSLIQRLGRRLRRLHEGAQALAQ